MSERLTEYHHGVAVIKEKKFAEAAAKLAKFEDAEEERRRALNDVIKKRIEDANKKDVE